MSSKGSSLLSRTDEVTIADLPERLRQGMRREESAQISSPRLLAIGLKTVERDMILQVLRNATGTIKSRASTRD